MTEETSYSHHWRELHEYVAKMKCVIRSWQDFFAQETDFGHFSIETIREWIDRLDSTIDILQHMYAYDTKRTLSVHPIASGFPSQLNIRKIEHLLLNGEEEQSLPALKRSFLDQLFETGRVNFWLLERISKATAKSISDKNEPHRMFAVRSVSRISDSNKFVCCFERYCNRQVPSLYALVFEYSGPSEITEADMELLASTAFEHSSFLPRLGTFAKHIDLAHVHIHPMWLGRITLGPVFIGGLTQDDHALQTQLDQLEGEDADIVASRIIYEYVVSTEHMTVGRVYAPDGRAHTRIQNFEISDFDSHASEREATRVDKYLFAPHLVIQNLDDQFRKEIGHRLIAVRR